MAAQKRIAGTCTVRVDGVPIALGSALTISPAAYNREGQVGLGGVVGYTETPRVPSIEIECRTSEDLDIETLVGVTNATVSAELGNGETWTLSNAWQAGEPDINAADGTITFKFEGTKCEKT